MANIVDTFFGPALADPKLKRGDSRAEFGLHKNSRRETRLERGGEKRHGSGKNRKEYAQACGGRSSPQK